MTPENTEDVFSAEAVIAAFGGLRPMAAKVGVPVTTIQGWKKRGAIPSARAGQIRTAAVTHNIDIEPLLTLIPSSPSTGNDIKQDSSPAPEVSFPRPAQVNSFPWPALWGGMVILTVAVLVGLAAMGFLMMQFTRQDRRLAILQDELIQMDTRLQAVKSQNAVLSGFVPENMKREISNLQSRAREIEQTVHELGIETQVLTENFSDSKEQSSDVPLVSPVPPLTKFLTSFAENQKTDAGKKENQVRLRAVQSLILDTTGDPKKMEERIKKDPSLMRLTQDDINTAAILLSLVHMQQALSKDGVAFDQDLATLVHAVKMQSQEWTYAIHSLMPIARQGVLTTDHLSRALQKTEKDVIEAFLASPDISVMDRFWVRLHKMVKIERNGRPLTGLPVQRSMEVARSLMAKGDISGAVAELQSLEGMPASVAASWVQDAEKTLMARKVHDMLVKTVSAYLSVQPSLEKLRSKNNAIDVHTLTEGLAASLAAGK